MFNQPKPSRKTKEPFIYPHHPNLHPSFNTTKDKLKSSRTFLLKNEVQKRKVGAYLLEHNEHLTYMARIKWSISAVVIISIYDFYGCDNEAQPWRTLNLNSLPIIFR